MINNEEGNLCHPPTQAIINALHYLPEHLHNTRIEQHRKHEGVRIYSHMLIMHKTTRIGQLE